MLYDLKGWKMIYPNNEIHNLAKSLTQEQRKNIIESFPEIELHKYLKFLFQNMEPDYWVEITHGPNEFGKDLVIVKKDKFNIDVIGVVVKKGNIKGTTSGEVDFIKNKIESIFSNKTKNKIEEILSQVNQAYAHPADLKSILEELPVTQVMVILAGDLSKAAKQRLLKEFDRPIITYDIKWLTEKFTEYYPQIFFESQVIDFIQDKINYLEMNNPITNKNVNLSEIFIDPMVVSIDNPLDFNDILKKGKLKRERLPFSHLKELILINKQIILTGDPGSGKSGALAKIAIEMFRSTYSDMLGESTKDRNKTFHIPLLTTANHLIDFDNSDSLIENYINMPGMSDRYVVSALLVDGLDEVPPEKREIAIQKANNFKDEMSCSLVIASRKIQIVESPIAQFEKFELLPFEYRQAIKLFEKLIGENELLFDKLKEGLRKIMNQIPLVPLSLLFLIELVEEHGEVPASVTELYDRFSDMALGRFDKSKGIEVLFEYLVKKNFIAQLAYQEFLEKGRLEIPKHDFDRFCEDYSRKYGWDQEVFIQDIDRGGILNLKEFVLFKHRSLLEYFAAYYIYENRAEWTELQNFIVQIYFDDLWGDVAFFYFGLRREIQEDIIQMIDDYEDPKSILKKFLMGKLLQAGWHSPTSTKYLGIEKAISYAPIIREAFTDFAVQHIDRFPKILSDIIILYYSNNSFGSGFLFKEIQMLIENIFKDPDNLTKDKLYIVFPLLDSIKRFLNVEDIKIYIDKVLHYMDLVEDINEEDQVRFLLIAMLMETNDESFLKSMKRKLIKMRKKYPYVFNDLLPNEKNQKQLK